MITKFKDNMAEYVRVFKITHKPTMDEFKGIIKVSAIGIAIIGGIGFLIHVIWTLLT